MSSASMSLRVPLPKHLQPIDELFLVLIRLQLEQDLVHQFNIGIAVVTQVWINQELTCALNFHTIMQFLLTIFFYAVPEI